MEENTTNEVVSSPTRELRKFLNLDIGKNLVKENVLDLAFHYDMPHRDREEIGDDHRKLFTKLLHLDLLGTEEEKLRHFAQELDDLGRKDLSAKVHGYIGELSMN